MESKIQELIDSNKEILQYIRNEKAKELKNDQCPLYVLFGISAFCLFFAILMLIIDIILEYRRYHEVPISNIVWDSVLWAIGICTLIFAIVNL